MRSILGNIKNRIKNFRKSFAKAIFDKKKKSGLILDMNNVRSVLFLRNDNKIGDMVVLTLVFRELKKQYPNIKISVLCGKDNKEIIKYNPNIDEIIETDGKLLNDVSLYQKLKHRKFDLAVDFFIFRPRPKHLFMVRRISPEFLIGFHKRNYNMYDISIDCDINELHISKRYAILLNELGVKDPSLKYDIYLDENIEMAAETLFKKTKNNLIINPFAASAHRSFSFEKLQNLINELKSRQELSIYIICAQKSSHLLKGLESATVLGTNSILESAAFIKYCDYIISPDTSIVHIAAAFGKKMLALFLDYSLEEEKISKVWAPGYSDAVELCVDTKNGVLENDIKNIDNNLITETFFKLIKGK